MAEMKASRTLVKSSPELWAECSHAGSLARHLGGFGEIRITRLEPETAVAWEGEDVRGTVTLETVGWGTRVVLTASAVPARAGTRPGVTDGPSRPAGGEAEPAAETKAEPTMHARHRFLRRLLGGPRRSPPAAVTDPGPLLTPTSTDALARVLDSLGAAHRRPFSHS